MWNKTATIYVNAISDRMRTEITEVVCPIWSKRQSASAIRGVATEKVVAAAANIANIAKMSPQEMQQYAGNKNGSRAEAAAARTQQEQMAKDIKDIKATVNGQQSVPNDIY